MHSISFDRRAQVEGVTVAFAVLLLLLSWPSDRIALSLFDRSVCLLQLRLDRMAAMHRLTGPIYLSSKPEQAALVRKKASVAAPLIIISAKRARSLPRRIIHLRGFALSRY